MVVIRNLRDSRNDLVSRQTMVMRGDHGDYRQNGWCDLSRLAPTTADTLGDQHRHT